jgi:hypothetical protein
MTVHRRELRPVPPNTGGPFGTIAYDDATGRLETTGLVTAVLRRDRARVNDDARFGRGLVEEGWSNGQLWLVRLP